jgi:hypothetical protein
MATTKELEAQLKALRELLRDHGIDTVEAVSEDVTDRPDYIAHGSDEHAALLGLVEVDNKEDTSGYTIFTSPSTDRTWRLQDEGEAVRHFPHQDPEKAAILLLRQKLNELEAGKPDVPADAPPLWRPADMPA